MPPLPDVPNVCKVRLNGDINGEPYVGVTHWRFVTLSGPLTTDNAAVIAAKFVNAWGDYMATAMASTCTLTSVDVTDLSSTTGAFGVAASSHVGAVSGEAISSAACVLEAKLLARRYRGGHPRTYWPGPTTGQTESNAGNKLTGTPFIDWQEDVNGYYGAIPPAVTTDGDSGCTSWHEVCVHYVFGGVHLSDPLVDDIVGRTVEAALATQRRRLHRV